MEVADSALKHGIADADILHAWSNAILVQEVMHDRTGLSQVLAIGPSRSGQLLELIAVPPWRVARIIHCMPLRPKFRVYLRGDA